MQARNLVTFTAHVTSYTTSTYYFILPPTPSSTLFPYTTLFRTEPGHLATAYGSVYCAYHSESAHSFGHGVRYSFMPYVPEQGAGCGQNFVNTSNDAYVHGYYEGYRVV